MPKPIAIFYELETSHEFSVTPSSDVSAGTGFVDPDTNKFLVATRDIGAGQLGGARGNGIFRCRKQTTSDVFAVGDTLEFASNGVQAGSDPLTVIKASVSGDTYVFAELNQPGGGGGGLTAGQAIALDDSHNTRSFIFSAAADDTAPVDTDWPEGTNPTEDDILLIYRTPTSRDRWEAYQRGASANVWTKIHDLEGSGASQMTKMRTSQLQTLVDVPAGTPVNMNAATATYTSALQLDYTSHDPSDAASFPALYHKDIWVQVNSLNVQEQDISRNDADPAGYVRFGFDIPAGVEILFISQVTA